MCMICNDVEQNLVTNEGVFTCRSIRDAFLFDVIVNHAHRDTLAYTKRKFWMTNATPRPLWALDPSKTAPLSCVVLVAMLHCGPAWVAQNVELFSLSTPAGGESFYRIFTNDPTRKALACIFTIDTAPRPGICSCPVTYQLLINYLSVTYPVTYPVTYSPYICFYILSAMWCIKKSYGYTLHFNISFITWPTINKNIYKGNK